MSSRGGRAVDRARENRTKIIGGCAKQKTTGSQPQPQPHQIPDFFQLSVTLTLTVAVVARPMREVELEKNAPVGSVKARHDNDPATATKGRCAEGYVADVATDELGFLDGQRLLSGAAAAAAAVAAAAAAAGCGGGLCCQCQHVEFHFLQAAIATQHHAHLDHHHHRASSPRRLLPVLSPEAAAKDFGVGRRDHHLQSRRSRGRRRRRGSVL